MSERETQFAGFARALQQEIWTTEVSLVPMMTSGYPTSQVAKELTEAVQLRIAQRAYDLACHVFNNTSSFMVDCLETHEAITRMPDLTKLPEVSK